MSGEWLCENGAKFIRNVLTAYAVPGPGKSYGINNIATSRGKYLFTPNKIEAMVTFRFQNSVTSLSKVIMYSYARRAADTVSTRSGEQIRTNLVRQFAGTTRSD